jgi:pimeloyl-ACP methyl ester carboxylesterase
MLSARVLASKFMARSTALSLVLLVGVTALATGCGERRSVPTADPLVPCIVPGIGRPAECGSVSVPEVADAAGASLALRVVRVPARRVVPGREALFLLAGGPGQAATEAFPALWPVMARLSEERDIVMVDARGTGASAALDCPHGDDADEVFRQEPLAFGARSCLTNVNGRALRAYGTEATIQDLDAVRARLGYATIDLLGVSYGTRVALGYAARYPAHVRTMVLDGVAPPELVLGASFGRDAEAALDAVLADCAAESACRDAFPDLRARFGRHLEALGPNPSAVELRHPETDAPIRVVPSRGTLAALVRGLSYAPELAALLPNTLSEVSGGRYQGLFGQALSLARSAEAGMSLGLLYTVACAEDVPRITDADREAEAQTLLGTTLLDDFRAACARWPVEPRPFALGDAPIATPTLLLSGAADPATPPRWAEALRGRLPRSRHVVVPQAGHGVWSRGCVPSLVETFLERATVDGLDVSCASDFRRPAFFLDRAGPRP